MTKIARGIYWSVFGTLTPLLSAFFAIPQLIAALGDARFGILSLAWVFVGYFGFFDLGIGRGLTYIIATQPIKSNRTELSSTIKSALFLMMILGLVGSLSVAALTSLIVDQLKNIDQELRCEASTSVYLLAASIPIVILSNGFRSILEGFNRFDTVNIIKGPAGVATYLIPLLVLMFSNKLAWIVLFLVIGRLLTLIAYAYFCWTILPDLRVTRKRFNLLEARKILFFGGWITVSNITGPLLLYVGRYILAALASPESTAYFSTSYDVVTALLLIPSMYVSVLFPSFTKYFKKSLNECRDLYYRWILITGLSIAPLCLIVYLFSETGLALWINISFAENSYRCAQILAIGVFVNSFGHISQALIQAFGRPDITAKLHIIELMLYLPYTWWLITAYGTEGAAAAWTIRVMLSTIALGGIAQLCLSGIIQTKTN